MKYLVGMDEGTTGCKVCVFDLNGNLISSAGNEYPCYYPNAGWVEQDIKLIKSKVFETCKNAIEKANINSNDIISVSYSNQGITFVPVDENGEPVFEHTIGWQDVRHVDIVERIKKNIDIKKYYETAGVSFGTYNTASLIWLQENDPYNWKKVKRVCNHQDYFLHELGGDYVIDLGNAAFLCFMNIKKDDWDEEILKLHGLTKNMLPRISLKPGEVVGKVTEKVSEETGLPVGCLVCLGGLDTNVCCFAAGALNVGSAVMVVGTAGTFTKISSKPNMDPQMIITNRRNPGTKNWQMYAMTNTAASSFRWFRDSLCSLEVAASKLMGEDPYNLMTEIASNSVPGSNGVTVLTCLQGAHVHHENENMKGTFFGIGLNTTKADIAHAILEGICYEMKAIMEMAENISDKVKEVRLCGGVTRSELWCQMFADILDVPILLMKIKEMGSQGAAMYAGIGAGIFKDSYEACERWSVVDKTYTPLKKSVEAYSKAYNIWKKGYNSVINNFYK